MQLVARRASFALALALPTVAGADGTVSVRGAYYKEKATRVQQPMVDARLDAGERGEIDLHLLIDSITSASAAAGAAGGAEFTERRYEFGGGYRHRFDDVRLSVGARQSTESDYASVFGHGRAEYDVADRSATIILGLAQGRDTLSNAGGQGMITESVRGTLHTTMLSTGLRQLVSETVTASAGYDFIYLSGFQENPYRLVPAGGQLELERVPEVRYRHAMSASVRAYLPRPTTTLVGSYRLYADDWGVVGHTPEVRVIQGLGDGIDLALRYRYHGQGAADFYREAYDTADPAVEPYLTADVKLSKMHTHTVGGKLAVELGQLGVTGSWETARADLMVEWIAQSTYVGDALVAELGLTVPLAY